MKKGVTVIFALILISGCIGQYPSETSVIQEHKYGQYAGTSIITVDTNDIFGDNPTEKQLDQQYATFGNNASECVAKTYFPQGYSPAGKKEVDRVFGFYEKRPELAEELLNHCITDEKTLDMYETLWQKDQNKAMELAQKGSLIDEVTIFNLDYYLDPRVAEKLYNLKLSDPATTKKLAESLKTYDVNTQMAVFNWFGPEMSQKEYETLTNATTNPTNSQLFGAWVRGQNPDENPDEFNTINKYVTGDRVVQSNVLLDIENPYSKLDFFAGSIAVDQEGNGFGKGLDRQYINRLPSIPGIDVINTLLDGKAYEVTKTPHFRPRLVTEPQNNFRHYSFDEINGNGHMVKLDEYDRNGNKKGSIWLDVRLEGIIYDTGGKISRSFIELNGDKDEPPEYIDIYTPPGEANPMFYLNIPDMPDQMIGFYPDIRIEDFEPPANYGPYHVAFGDRTNQFIQALGPHTYNSCGCYVGDQYYVGYNNCYEKSPEFRRTTRIFWTLFHSPYGKYENYPTWIWNTFGK